MNEHNPITGILLEETLTISFNEVCHKYHIPKELLHEMMEYGLFSSKTTQESQLKLNQKDLRIIETAFRLHQDLEINLPGVALALELLERIDRMNEELSILRKHF